jgi:DNA-binding YbaB/EbfC family protein
LTIPGLEDLMRQAQAFTQRLAQMKADLAREVVSASAGGGMVTAEANGRGQLLKVTIEPQVADPDELEMLQDLVVAAVNQALAKAKELAAEKTRQLTGGIPIPGIEELFGGGL